MAVAAVIKARDVSSLKRLIVELTFSGTYTTGGEVTTAGFKKDLAMSKIHMVNFMQSDVETAAGLIAGYDITNNKVFLRETAGTVDLPFKELSSGASLTNVKFLAEFIGEGNN
jgi:hypothetical protein